MRKWEDLEKSMLTELRKIDRDTAYILGDLAFMKAEAIEEWVKGQVSKCLNDDAKGILPISQYERQEYPVLSRFKEALFAVNNSDVNEVLRGCGYEFYDVVLSVADTFLRKQQAELDKVKHQFSIRK